MPSVADAYADRRVLVTGGLGFIGSNLVIALADAGAHVTLVDALLPAYGGQLFNVDPVRTQVRIDQSDLRDAPAVRRVVADQEVIFNLAGQMSHMSSMRDPATDLEINCRAQLSLLEACRAENPGVKLVLASTRQVYGRPQRLPVDETHPTLPIDINGIHKLAAEMYYGLYGSVHGLRSVILRLTNTYGPRMDLRSRDKGVVSTLLRNALTGRPLQLFGTGRQQRDFNYITDVVDAILLAGAAERLDGGCFNLGHPQPHSLMEVARLLQTLTGCHYECVPFPTEQQAIDIGDYAGDFTKFRAAAGWTPHIDLATGLAKTVGFFRAHAAHYL